MADLKISQFVDGGPVEETDEIAANRSGINTKVFFGSAAALDAGTGTGDLVILEDVGGSPGLPAVDGSQLLNLPIPTPTVDASDLTGTTLAPGVVASSLTSLGSLSGLTMAGNIAMGANNITTTGSIGATGARALKLWAIDAEFTNAPTIGGTAATGSGGLVRETGATLTGATVNGATPITANQKFIVNAGTSYTITATSAPVDNGTTDPIITLDAPGTYLLMGYMRVEYNAATFAASRTITCQINRTNNTPGLINGAAREFFNTAIETTQTKTGPIFNFFYIYTTANSDDILQLYTDVSVLPSAGSISVGAGAAKLMAIRLTQ